MKYINYILIFAIGILVGKFIFEKKEDTTREEIITITNGINNLSKLVVSEGNFEQIYTFEDSKKYFFDHIEFDKKAVISTNTKVEIGYDLSKLDIKIDSINKKIIINHIPDPEINTNSDIKYITLDDSVLNKFTTEEHNKLTEKANKEIDKTIDKTNLIKDAKHRLMEELAKIFQLSKVYHWMIINNTSDMDVNDQLMFFNREENERLMKIDQ